MGDARRQREAARVAAVVRVQLAVERNDARGDRAQRHLIGGIPLVGIGHRGHRHAVGGGALAVAHHPAELAHVVGIDPRPVVGDSLGGDEHVTLKDLGRADLEQPLVAEAASRETCRARRGVLQADGKRAGVAEIADVGEEGALADVERIDGLRHEEVQVGIALAVGVGAQVDRHVVDGDRNVGAVIEIEAAQEILVGLAFAAVLRHRQAGRRFKEFARARDRTRVEIVPAHRHLAGEVRRGCRAGADIRRARTGAG